MNKKYIKSVTLLVLISFATLINSFAQNNSINLEVCTKNCENNFSFITNNNGQLKVKIINSSDRIMAMPFFNKSFKAKEEINFNVDTKHWKPGNYLLVIENDNGQITTQKIKINANALLSKQF